MFVVITSGNKHRDSWFGANVHSVLEFEVSKINVLVLKSRVVSWRFSIFDENGHGV